MEALLQSLALVTISEMGDKTQLLALVLALRYKKPLVVMLGILVATLLNHGVATALGTWVGGMFSEETLRTALAIIFVVFAVWILVPDKLDDEDLTKAGEGKWTNAFFATVVLFFFAEMGDKTQLATVALGAKFQSPVMVTIGTTAGMLIADGLAVVFGERLTKIIPMNVIRVLSAISFAVFGALIYFS